MTEAVSASWALAQVLANDDLDLGIDRVPSRGRDYTRMVSRLRSAGLLSLAATAHCFFMTSQAINLFDERKRQLPTKRGFGQSHTCFVDDWVMFSENATAVAASSARSQLAHCANSAAKVLGSAGMAFESRQLLVFGSHFEVDDQSLVPSTEMALLQAISLAYKPIDERLAEALGLDEYRSLPDRVREALREAERQHDLASGDSVLTRTPRTTWVLEYAKIVELLLKEKLDLLWGSELIELSRDCFGVGSRRPLPSYFSPGAALRLLRSISQGNGAQLRARLSERGVDIEVLGGPLGRELETYVLRIRNLQAHEATPISPDDAARCRQWVLRNIIKILDALSPTSPTA